MCRERVPIGYERNWLGTCATEDTEKKREQCTGNRQGSVVLRSGDCSVLLRLDLVWLFFIRSCRRFSHLVSSENRSISHTSFPVKPAYFSHLVSGELGRPFQRVSGSFTCPSLACGCAFVHLIVFLGPSDSVKRSSGSVELIFFFPLDTIFPVKLPSIRLVEGICIVVVLPVLMSTPCPLAPSFPSVPLCSCSLLPALSSSLSWTGSSQSTFFTGNVVPPRYLHIFPEKHIFTLSKYGILPLDK